MSDKRFANVSLLAGFNGADGATAFTSEDAAARTATFVGNAQLDTADKKWGSASLLVDGNDEVTFPNHADFDFGTGDFTIELWCKATTYPTAYSAPMGKWTATSNQRGWDLGYRSANNRWEFFWSTNGSNSNQLNGSIATATGGWHHIAVSRIGADLRMFQDGVQDGSTANIGSNRVFQSSQPVRIGRGSATSTAEYWNGWIDDVRITKGVGRYAANFTPPRGPFSRGKRVGMAGQGRSPTLSLVV